MPIVVYCSFSLFLFNDNIVEIWQLRGGFAKKNRYWDSWRSSKDKKWRVIFELFGHQNDMWKFLFSL